MYKVFAGGKCVIISSHEVRDNGKNVKRISFKSREILQKEYSAFFKQHRVKKLIIAGEEEKIWKVFRSFFTYIEAAGGIVKNEQGKLLMIFRKHHWDLPKGKMEKGESPAITAIREVQEECGVKNLRIVKETSSSFYVFFKNNECLKRTYWYEMICKDSAKPIPQVEEGIMEAKWMNRKDVKKIADKIYPSLREVLASTFSF